MSKITAKVVALFCAGLLALTGCTQSPQTAAQVGDRRFTAAEVAPIAEAIAHLDGSKETAAGMTPTVVTLLIRSEIAHLALAKAGKTYSETDRQPLYDGNPGLAGLATQPATKEFIERYADFALLTSSDDGVTQFTKALSETKITVNPRYGNWDPTQAMVAEGTGSLSELAPTKS